MDGLQEACDYLRQTIAEYSAVRSMPAIETAILAMHTGLETAFRAYLEGNDRLPIDIQEALKKPGGVSFPGLVDMVGDHTDVLGVDLSTRALLVSLNTTRVQIAHPLDKPSREQIVNDAQRLAELIVAFWPRLFVGRQVPRVTPVTLRMVREGAARTNTQTAPLPDRSSIAPQAKEKQRPTRVRFALLQSLWQGEIKPYRWFRRLVGGLVVAVLAGLAWNPAVALARWPPPVKTVSVVLAIVAFGLVVWSGWLIWRVFRLLGVRRILILLTILYLSAVSVRVLTVEENRSLAENVPLQMQRVASEGWGTLAGFVRSLIEAPSTFRFAYTGRNPLLNIPGIEVNPIPIEGKIIEPLVYTTREELTSASIPAPMQTPIPSEPGINKEIQVGSWVEVSGTDGKTLRARSGAGTSYGIVTRFDEGTRLRVLEGPVEADGYDWWKVHADQDEGWCADQWLIPVR